MTLHAQLIKADPVPDTRADVSSQWKTDGRHKEDAVKTSGMGE